MSVLNHEKQSCNSVLCATDGEMHRVYALCHTFLSFFVMYLHIPYFYRKHLHVGDMSYVTIVRQRSSRILQMKCMQKVAQCTFSHDRHDLWWQQCLSAPVDMPSHWSAVCHLYRDFTDWMISFLIYAHVNTFATVLKMFSSPLTAFYVFQANKTFLFLVPLLLIIII